MLNDTLAAALSKIFMASKIGANEVVLNPMSKQINIVLSLLKEEGYVGDLEKVSDYKCGTYKLNLVGNINNCGVIKPRHSVGLKDFEKFEKRYLIGKDFGFLIVSTPKGMMTHQNAKKEGLGGILIAFCY